MAGQDDISSTDKLLKVIRSKKDEAPAPSGVRKPLPDKTGDVKVPSKTVIPMKKSSTVGIDIGHEYLHLVQSVKSSDGKWRITNRRRLNLPKTSRNAPEFSDFLKASLASFCGSAKQSNLWAVMSAAEVDVRHIRIPKVPRKQIANSVYWTTKRESPFEEKEKVFDFESRGEVIEQGISKLAAMVYTAPRQEIEALKRLFSGIGWPLTGISIVPFAMQNFFRTGWMSPLEGSIASLFIGNDFSRIDIFNGGNLVMTRGIKAGTNSMVESLVERFNELKQGPEASLTMEQGRKIVHSLSPDSPPLEETDAGFGLRKEEIFEMIQPALERLVRQVERTFEHYATTGGIGRIVKIFVSGTMNVYQPLIEYVGSQLDIDRAVLDPLSEQDVVSCPDVDDSRCISERIAFAPALGLALSDNAHTPNLMFTYKDKEKAASITLINRGIFAVFIAAVLLCTGVFVYQNLAISQKKAGIAKLEAQLASLGPSVDRDQLSKMTATVKKQRQLSKAYAERYLGMVMISEFAALTPANIRLLDLKINLRRAAAGGAANPPPEKGTPIEEATVEGLILGERQKFETSLAGYTMLLGNSPLFQQVTIQKNTVEPYLRGEALHFILNLKVKGQVHG